ncbi:putative methyltransferase NSUN7 isoform X2 [Cololabis saira]|uniref:putative methyltransferase NSUN7 isoform X2 n=1 Tax=Cololabis saira TaxID=129043 RepID=UPI002AD37AEA|nr:putative methyltransferase NSUN7 isoform X2 [Cololabis saira]
MLKIKKKKEKLSFTRKTKKAGSQAESEKDVSPLKDAADGKAPGAGPGPRTTSHRLHGFHDSVYLLASVIFQNNHQEKPPAQRMVNYGKVRGHPLPQVKDKETKRSAFELAFSALKYQELLEGTMIDSCIHLSRPVPDDQMSLVAVMLFDFQDRKFLPRKRQWEEEIVQEVRAVEKYLLRSKIKLAAAMARYRVKNDLLYIENILPETVKKKQERSINLPLYAWVNTQKTSFNEVQNVLSNAGFSQVKSVELLEGPSFCYDPHCGDTLVFPAQPKAQLYCTKLLSDHKLIIQDKSCSLGPSAACSLLPEEGDILMVGCFSGLTVSHTASLIAQKHRATSNSQPVVYVCVSNCTHAQREELQLTVSTMGCKNVKLMQEDFQSLDSGDKCLQKVRVILLIPRCSMSAVNNPVEFILEENEDINLLQDLSRGSISKIKLESLVEQQRKDIDHALKFPMVSAIVYSTCSSYPEENVDVVTRALQQAKACSDQKGDSKQVNFRPSPSPFNTSDHGEVAEETEPFFSLEPSEFSSGCFLAVLEPEPVIQEEPQEVIARANAKGILDRIGSNHLTGNRHTRRMRKTAHVRSCSEPHLSLSMQSKSQQTKGSSTALLSGDQDLVHLQASKRKPKGQSLQALRTTMSRSFSYSTTTTLDAACSPATTTAPILRPRRSQQEVVKRVVLVLPTITIPNPFPFLQKRELSPSRNYNKLKDICSK